MPNELDLGVQSRQNAAVSTEMQQTGCLQQTTGALSPCSWPLHFQWESICHANIGVSFWPDSCTCRTQNAILLSLSKELVSTSPLETNMVFSFPLLVRLNCRVVICNTSCSIVSNLNAFIAKRLWTDSGRCGQLKLKQQLKDVESNNPPRHSFPLPTMNLPPSEIWRKNRGSNQTRLDVALHGCQPSDGIQCALCSHLGTTPAGFTLGYACKWQSSNAPLSYWDISFPPWLDLPVKEIAAIAS